MESNAWNAINPHLEPDPSRHRSPSPVGRPGGRSAKGPDKTVSTLYHHYHPSCWGVFFFLLFLCFKLFSDSGFWFPVFISFFLFSLSSVFRIWVGYSVLFSLMPSFNFLLLLQSLGHHIGVVVVVVAISVLHQSPNPPMPDL